MRSVAHLNDLYEEFKSKGLSVVGVTGEKPEKTEPWVDKHGATYPYTYLEGPDMSTFMQKLGMRGYPTAALIAPNGKVAWVGSPSQINGSLVKKHLRGASKTPVDIAAVTKRWPASAKAVKAAYAKGKIGKAMAAAEKLTDDRGMVVEDLKKVVARRVAAVKKAHGAGDFLGALDGAGALVKSLAGLPEATEMAELQKAIKADKAAAPIIKAQKKIAKIAKKLPDMKSKDVGASIKKLRKIESKNADNFAGKSADKLIKKLMNKSK